MKRSGSQRAPAIEPLTALDGAELAIVDGGRFGGLFGGGKSTPKDTPPAAGTGAPPGTGTQGKPSTGETVKQAAIFGTAFTGLGIAGNSLFGPEQGSGQAAPPPSTEPLDYL